jgi:NhaA family Na+:H+ antiporter
VFVIAIAYTEAISLPMLGLAAVGTGAILLCRWLGVRGVPVYLVIGASIWLAFLKSGIHPTVAGVLLGLLTPSGPWFGERSLLKVLAGTGDRLREDNKAGEKTEHHEEAVRLLSHTARETISPLDRLDTALQPWVAFGIMPLFALANAGLHVELPALASPVAVAVAVGLMVGKPLGLVVFSAVAIKLGWARLPDGVSWPMLVGAGFLAGIGFTMSLFIAGLALEGDLLESGKIGTLTGSAVSALVGCALLWWFLKHTGRRDE